jgi:hypothetical protein
MRELMDSKAGFTCFMFVGSVNGGSAERAELYFYVTQFPLITDSPDPSRELESQGHRGTTVPDSIQNFILANVY